MARSNTTTLGVFVTVLVSAGAFGCRAHAAAPRAAQTIHASWEEPLEQARAIAAEHARATGAPLPVGVGAVGAAGALARSDAPSALARLNAGSADPGTDRWVLRHTTRGRALRLAGRPGDAVAALEAAAQANTKGRSFPPDVLGYELAGARIEWATGESAPADPDKQLQLAASELAKLTSAKPLRNLAELRVLHARALAAVHGGGGRGRRVAAQKAEKALSKMIGDYPNHPAVGELRLMQAEALERMEKPREAFEAMRAVWIERTGEPESLRAREAMQRLAAENKGLEVKPPGHGENLQRSKNARWLRRADVSREILDGILARQDLPRYQLHEAMRERAYTAYRQRDFARCASDLRELYKTNASVRADLVRCLERGHQYDEAMQVYLDQADKRSGGGAAAFVWEAIELGFRGGRYKRVRELSKRYSKLSKGHGQRRAYLDAWVAYRLGEYDKAVDGLQGFARTASGDERRHARYFRGKIMFLRMADAKQKAQGRELLTLIAEEDPLGYYGLAARQRLLDGGITLPDIELKPMADEADPPNWEETGELLQGLAARHGDAFDGLPRAAQLHAAGYIEEARRELRFVNETVLNGLARMRGGSTHAPRSEALYVGLAWKAKWDYPKPIPSGAGRAVLRHPEQRDRLQAELRRLSHGMDEGHHFAKLTRSSDHPVAARWHPRAYREAVEREARAQQIEPEHLWALMYTESRFRRHVVSPVGARGALQIMPNTGRLLATRLDLISDDDRFDADRLFEIDFNARLAAYYVAELLRKFQGQPTFAYASYNGGPNSVARWLTGKYGPADPIEVDTFIEEIPFSETYRYAKRVMEVHAAYHLLYRGELPRWNNAVNPKVGTNIDF